MSITLELKPELEARLRREADRVGVPLPDYMLALLDGDRLLQSLATAPEDDEPETEEEKEAVREAYEDLAAGRIVSHGEARRRLLP